MTAGSRHLQGALHTLLTTHIGKVEVEMALLLVKLPAGIDTSRFEALGSVEEVDDLGDMLHAIHVEVVDHGCLADVLPGHYQSLEMLCTGAYGYGQGTTDGLQGAIETQFTYEHIVLQHAVLHIAIACQQSDGQGQVVTAALLAYVGWRHVDGDVCHREAVTVVHEGSGYAVATLTHGLIAQSCEMKQHATGDAHLYGHCSDLQSVDRRTVCFY